MLSMKAADLVGITAMGLVMVVVGAGIGLVVDDSGLAAVGFVIAGIGGVAMLFGLLAVAVFAGVRAGRRD